jgi:hypothetical protein
MIVCRFCLSAGKSLMWCKVEWVITEVGMIPCRHFVQTRSQAGGVV